MWFTKGNVNVKVSRASDAEVEWLRSRESGLAIHDRSTLHATGKVGLKRFYDLLDHTFPAGFLPTVADRARAAGFEVEVIDGREPAEKPVPVDLKWLEAVKRLDGTFLTVEHQMQAVNAALEKERGIISVPTGGGKTEIAIGVVKSVPTSWLFLVHRQTLMEQAAQRYELRTGKKAGRIGAGQMNVEMFTVATFQSLAAMLRDPKKEARAKRHLAFFKGLIVDECHVLPAESFQNVALEMPNARYRIGISGTPLDREDQRSVYAVGILGPVIFKVASQQLIDQGLLAKPLIRMISLEQEFDERDKHGLLSKWGWDKVYFEGIVRSQVRNKALLAAVRRAEKPCLVFVKEIDHGKAFARAVAKRDIKSDFVWGTTSLKTRQAAARRLVRGDIDVLVCSVIFQEGVDIPELRSVVVAAGGKSVIAALQRIGRGMRRADGKDTFEVWDVADGGNAWLTRHARKRQLAYQREGYSVSVVHLTQSTAKQADGPQGTLFAP